MASIGLACRYCGETVATETDERGIFASDEFHGCIGERLGFLGEICSDRILTVEEVEIVEL